MTDEQMIARLRSAGEAWRIATDPAPDEIASVEPAELTAAPGSRPRRHRTGLLASAAIVVAALVAGGSVLIANLTGNDNRGGADTETAVPLVGTVWRFLGYGDQLQSHSLATFYISPTGELVADDACDLITGHASVDNDRLAISQPDVRYYNCTDSVGEVVFDPDLLTATPTYSLGAGGELTITGGGRTMHLIAAPDLPVPTADRPTLTGAMWKLVTVTGPDGTDHPVSGEATLRIDNGQLQANDTCNPVSGPVTVTGTQLDPGEIAVGASGCLDNRTAPVVDGVLTHSARTMLLGATLTIGMTGQGTLGYQWVPSDTEATDPANLTGRLWQLSSVAGDPVSAGVVLNIGSDVTLSGSDGCRKLDAHAQIGAGTLSITGIPPADFPPTGCDSDLATTVDSLLTQRSALWRIDDGKLVINGAGAQAFALVFQQADRNETSNEAIGLTSTPWRLVGAKDANGNDLPVGGNPTFSVGPDGQVKGNDGCNSMTGDAQLADHTIDFGGGLAITEMACLDDKVTATAQHVDAMLRGQVEWSVEGDQLTLVKSSVGTLVYQAGSPPPPAHLVGTKWRLTTIEQGSNANGTASSVVTRVIVVFDGSGNVTISHRCYIDQGDVQTGANTLDISHKQLQSAIPCAATPTQQQEQDENQVVDDVLSGHSTWSIDQGRLRITKDGVGTIVLTS